MTTLFIDRLNVTLAGEVRIKGLTLFAEPGQTLGLFGDDPTTPGLLIEVLAGRPPEKAGVQGLAYYGNLDLMDGTNAATDSGRPGEFYRAPAGDGSAGGLLLLDHHRQAGAGDPERNRYPDATTVIASSSLDHLSARCNAIAVFSGGHLLEHHPVPRRAGMPVHPAAQAMISGQALGRPAGPDGCPYRPACSHAAPHCAEADMVQQMIDVDHSSACVRWRELPVP